jgi:hypothetical protein
LTDFELGLTVEPNNKSLLDELKKLPSPKVMEKSPLDNSQKKVKRDQALLYNLN